ncbi:MAG: DUF2141 domain-containing protein [Myxococcales bacterium]|nr:DUF2141 domain-containing protein [Myxococcales bacterium]
MKTFSRYLAGAVLLLPLAGDLSAAESKPGIEITTHPRSGRGKVGCTLFASERGFPAKSELAHRRTWALIVKGKAICRFANVKPGTYAVAVLHDENGNNKMDTNWVGMPKEGYGASRDAKPGTFSGPKFKDARFRYPGGRVAMTLKLRY